MEPSEPVTGGGHWGDRRSYTIGLGLRMKAGAALRSLPPVHFLQHSPLAWAEWIVHVMER